MPTFRILKSHWCGLTLTRWAFIKREVILFGFEKNTWNAGLPATPLGIKTFPEVCVLREYMLFKEVYQICKHLKMILKISLTLEANLSFQKESTRQGNSLFLKSSSPYLFKLAKRCRNRVQVRQKTELPF